MESLRVKEYQALATTKGKKKKVRRPPSATPSENGGARRASSNGKPRQRVTAEAMAKKQRDISVSEFFAKNRHLLGFDSPRKSLLTTVKEAVDNSLDACEEAGIAPEIWVDIEPTKRASIPGGDPGQRTGDHEAADPA